MLEPTRMGGALAVAFLLAVPAAAEDRPLPPQLVFVTSVLHLYDESYGTPGYKRLDFQEYDFRSGGKQRGKYWQLRGTMDSKSPAENMAAMKAAFLKSGWTVAEEKTAGGALLTLHLSQKGVDSWAEGSFGEEVRVTLVEVGANGLSFALNRQRSRPIGKNQRNPFGATGKARQIHLYTMPRHSTPRKYDFSAGDGQNDPG